MYISYFSSTREIITRANKRGCIWKGVSCAYCEQGQGLTTPTRLVLAFVRSLSLFASSMHETTAKFAINIVCAVIITHNDAAHAKDLAKEIFALPSYYI